MTLETAVAPQEPRSSCSGASVVSHLHWQMEDAQLLWNLNIEVYIL